MIHLFQLIQRLAPVNKDHQPKMVSPRQLLWVLIVIPVLCCACNHPDTIPLADLALFERVELTFSETNQLISLEVANSYYNSTIPESFFKVMTLKKLSVWENHCEVLYPDDPCGQLRIMPEEIGNLSQLEYLNWSDIGIAELPKRIVRLQKLKKLSIAGNPSINNVEIIFKIQSLTHLSLAYCRLDSSILSVENFSKLPELESVLIRGNNLSELYLSTLEQRFPNIDFKSE